MNDYQKYAVNPKDYSGLTRIYLDVDGVVFPYSREEEDSVPYGNKTASIIFNSQVLGNEGKKVEAEFSWNETVIDRLSAISHNPKVDVVWLTAWQHNAPQFLDLILNITSLGYLPWQIKRSDYSQVFKLVAIEEEQQAFPSPFIWIDDVANQRNFSHPKKTLFSKPVRKLKTGLLKKWVTTIPGEQYLTVTPNSFTGLTLGHLDEVEKFITDNS